MVPTKDVSGLKDGGDGGEAKPWGRETGLGVCEDEHWVTSVVVVIAGRLPDADAVEGAVDVLWRDDIEKRTEGELLESIVGEAGRMLCKAEERDEHGEPNHATGGGRA